MSAPKPTSGPFVVKQTHQGRMTPQQTGLLLASLASDALVIKDMATRCADNAADVVAVCNYCTVIGALVERMAWMADTMADAVCAGSAIGVCGAPLTVFMPTSFDSHGGEA